MVVFASNIPAIISSDVKNILAPNEQEVRVFIQIDIIEPFDDAKPLDDVSLSLSLSLCFFYAAAILL